MRSIGRKPLRTASRATLSIRSETSPSNQRSEGSSAAHRAFARLGLKCPPLIDACRESGEIEAGAGETGIARPVFDETIGYADVQHRYLQPGGGEQFADARTRAADCGILLDGDDCAVTFGKR